MGWGRNAADATTAALPPRPVRYGAYSIVLALAAPSIVSAAFWYLTSLPKGAPAEDIATFMALGSYGVVAPILHAIGVGFGIAGLRNSSASKAASILGILLNIALVALGLLLGWAAISTIGAFT